TRATPRRAARTSSPSSAGWPQLPTPPCAYARSSTGAATLCTRSPVGVARRSSSTRRRLRGQRVDRLGQLEDLVRDGDQRFVLRFFGLHGLPLVIGEYLPLRIGAVLADHHEGRQ